MKHLFILLAVCALVSSSQAQDTTRVLFLGNSYTYYNDFAVRLDLDVITTVFIGEVGYLPTIATSKRSVQGSVGVVSGEKYVAPGVTILAGSNSDDLAVSLNSHRAEHVVVIEVFGCFTVA